MPSLGPAGRGGARRRTRRRMRRRGAMPNQAGPPPPAPQQQPQPPVTGGEEEPAYLGELEKLGELRDKGILTQEEFEAKKKQLLGL